MAPPLTTDRPAQQAEAVGPGPKDYATAQFRTGEGAFQLYLREIGPLPMLKPGEELELARRIQAGDVAAREQMIQGNLRLVVKIARDYEGFGLPLLDLISEGNIGLMTAVDRFDPSRGARLSTYAALWIKQHIRRALANQSRTIRVPVHVYEKVWRINRVVVRLRHMLGHEPSPEELAAEVGLPAAKVSRWRDALVSSVPLDAGAGEDHERELMETVADERIQSPAEDLSRHNLEQLVEESIGALTCRELSVLRCRFGLGGEEEKTLEEIGAALKLTRERIRQIQNSALHKLRARIEAREAMTPSENYVGEA